MKVLTKQKRNKHFSGIFYGAVGFTFLIASYPVCAQNDKDIFEQYQKKSEELFAKAQYEQTQVFEGYRDKMNKAFSSYLEREWKQTDMCPALKKDPKPEPEPIYDAVATTKSHPLPFSEPKIIDSPAETPSPVEPIQDVAQQELDNVIFTYLGNECKVRVPQKNTFSIRRGTKEEMSKAWQIMSGEAYNSILVDCLCLRKSLSLCDWAFFQLVQAFTTAYYGNALSNDAVMMQTYVLTQLGYKVRLAKQDDNLLLLMAFDGQIFSVPYIEVEETKYYCFSEKAREGGMQLCDFRFEGERAGSLSLNRRIPSVPRNDTEERLVKAKHNPLSAKVAPNKNLIEFYNHYPECSCEILASASLSRQIKDQLYPQLKKELENLSESQAAGLLLDFVQTGFDYMTDLQQFGREKAFFGDELFYYPYCDCEDRSILFSILIRDLLHLDVVLLDYPSHIATAVRFTENVTGDYFYIDGHKYLICDPTYIGAPIGKSMPEMLTQKASILKIK